MTTNDADSHGSREHSDLGASIADRWIHCPRSIRLSEEWLASTGIVPITGPDAIKGTAAHELAELCLRNGMDAAEMIDRKMPVGIYVDEEMAEAVQLYLDECRKYMREEWEFFIERRFNLARLNPPRPMFGTCDFVAINRKRRLLVVVDLKYGVGVTVKVEGNPQLRYYGLGALITLDGVPIDKAELFIVQPRAVRGTKVKRAEIDVVELTEWSVELLAAAEETQDPNARIQAGSWCKFCPMSGHCETQAQARLEDAQVEFGECTDLALVEVGLAPTVPEMRVLTPERIAALLLAKPQIIEFLNAVERAGTELIMSGVDVPGFKVIQGEKRQAWKDDVATPDILTKSLSIPEEHVFNEPKLRTPKQVEKAYRKILKAREFTTAQIDDLVDTLFSDLYHKPAGAPQLAPATDTRAALGARGSEFDLIDAPDPVNL